MSTIDDEGLRRRIHRLAWGGGWSAAVLTDDGVRTLTHRVDPDAELEIGSVSKGLTGLLLADARERGEVADDDPLAVHLPRLEGSPAGKVTLGSLAVHRSGLPALPKGLAWSRSARWLVQQRNPYGDDLDTLLDQARRTPVGRPRRVYSNLGFQLLGHAVAAAAGTTYADLLRDRLAGPLAMTSVTVPATAADLGPHAVLGHGRWGRGAAAWTGEGLGPAGGVRMRIGDAGLLLTALVDGTAPGLAALDPVADFGVGGRIGAGWMVAKDVAWHNGATGGFRTWLGVDRSRGAGVALVRTRAASADHAGRALLSALTHGR